MSQEAKNLKRRLHSSKIQFLEIFAEVAGMSATDEVAKSGLLKEMTSAVSLIETIHRKLNSAFKEKADDREGAA